MTKRVVLLQAHSRGRLQGGQNAFLPKALGHLFLVNQMVRFSCLIIYCQPASLPAPP